MLLLQARKLSASQLFILSSFFFLSCGVVDLHSAVCMVTVVRVYGAVHGSSLRDEPQQPLNPREDAQSIYTSVALSRLERSSRDLRRFRGAQQSGMYQALSRNLLEVVVQSRLHKRDLQFPERFFTVDPLELNVTNRASKGSTITGAGYRRRAAVTFHEDARDTKARPARRDVTRRSVKARSALFHRRGSSVKAAERSTAFSLPTSTTPTRRGHSRETRAYYRHVGVHAAAHTIAFLCIYVCAVCVYIRACTPVCPSGRWIRPLERRIC